jgi:multidrug efflux pump subunit AcrA (membrane-fusion protein)
MNSRRDRPSRPWLLYALGVVAIAVAVLAVTEIGPPTSSARTSKEIVTAEQGVVQSTVTGSGNIAAGTDVSVNFNTSGTLQDVYVKLGQHVNGGQLLADLDPTSADLQLSQAQEQLTSAEDQLTCLQDQTTANCGSGGSGGSGAGSGSSGSGSSGSTSTTSYAPNSSGTVEFASFTPGAGKRKKPTSGSGQTPTSGSGKTPTKSGTKVTKTTPSVTVTVVVPSTSRSSGSGSGGSAPKTSSTATTTTTSTPSPSSLASAQASVYSAQAAVHNAELAVNQTKLYAPTSGTIASLSSLTPGDAVSAGGSSGSSNSSSSSSSSSGSGASGATTAGSLGGSGSSSSGSSSGFAEIVNTNSLTMTVAFSESDISKVKVGQPATVSLDALAGVQLAAHISSISLVGTTSSSVVSYDATLTLDQNDSQVKPGMSASASVITGQASGVTVPNQAVTGSGSLGTVTLQKNGKDVTQQVVVGLRGDSRTQIISGVNAGDQLVITIALPSLGSTSTGSSGTGSGTLGGGGLGGFGGGGFGGGGGGAFFRRAAGGG